jgi:hypothetical protein
MLAALPLCARRVGRVLSVGDVTLNYWSPNGDLLVDPQADVARVLAVLLDGLGRLPWPLLWFDCVPFDWPHWQALLVGAERAGWRQMVRPRYRVGQVDMGSGFDAYSAGWSKSHRRNLRRDMRRLEETGDTRLVLHRTLQPDEVEEPLRRALAIEDSGWKGREASSVLRSPEIFAFFLRQARQLAAWGDLSLALLEHAGQAIACEYGWVSKRVYYSYKIGYDETYRRYAPGHLVRWRLLEALATEGVERVDFCGPMTSALSAWSNVSYPVGRVILAPPWLTSRALLAALRVLAWSRRTLRRRPLEPAANHEA